MRAAIALILIACGGGNASEPARRAPLANTRTAPTATPTLAASVRLGGPPTWSTLGPADAMRWCPGDTELVVIDVGGALHRYRTSDGAELSVVPVGVRANANDERSLDCRADGAAATVDGSGAPLLIARDGTIARPPKPVAASSVAFGTAGSVLLATDSDGVMRWAGDQLSIAIAPRAHQLETLLAPGGTFVEQVLVADDKPVQTWFTPDGGRRVQLPGTLSDLARASAAPDGSLALAGIMNASAWVVANGVPAKPVELLDASGTRIDGIAATDDRFIAVDAGGSLVIFDRPRMTKHTVERPCGDSLSFSSFAVASAGPRVAFGCATGGVRIVDLDTGKRVDARGVDTSAVAVAWSPDGSRLATRDRAGTIRVWRGDKLARTIDPPARGDGPSALWWQAADVLGGLSDGKLATWTIADGVMHAGSGALEAGYAARSASGVVIAARRDFAHDADLLWIDGTPIAVPASRRDWIDGLAIDDAGEHALVWRGVHADEPAQEVLEIDVAKRTVETRELSATAVAIAPNNTWVSADGATLVRHDAGGVTTTLATLAATVVALDVRGDVIAAGMDDGSLAVVTLDGKLLATARGHDVAVRAVAIAPDGVHVASTADDGTTLWQ